MKNFTLLILLLIIFWALPNPTLFAQTDHCSEFDIQLEALGVYCGATKGAIKVDIIGGKSGEYVVEWDNHDNSVWASTNTFFDFHMIEDLKPGNYTVKVMDFRTKCFVEKKITLSTNAVPKDLVLEGNPTRCNGYGSISVRMAKQKKPVYLSINGPISGNYVAHSAKFKIFNLPAGEYEVRFEKDGCYTTTTAIVPPDKGMPYLEVNALKNDCNINTGIVDFNIDATGAEYTLSWSGPTSGSTTLTESTSLEDFQTGSYQFELEDANGCKSIAMATINREELEVALTAKESRCAFNGKIDVAIAGGLAPYSIRWEGAGSGSRKVNSQETRLSLPKGTYIVYVTDANGCEAYASTTIVEETTDLYCSITPYATTCLLDNGKIDIFISGGRKPYVLAYEGPVSGSKTVNGSTVFDDLPAGTYTTYLEDANGCSVSESSTIEVGEVKNATAAFTYVATGTSVNFYNNSTYGTYEWSFGDGESTTSTHPNHAYTKEGSYEVCLTATGECDANTICQTIIITAFVPITQEEKVKTNTPQSSGEMSNEGMRVLQNFPNPFSSTTDILFELPEAQTTTIMVHDQFGRTINSQTSYYEKGLNRFTFQQDKLAPGIYYYTIKAGNTTQTKRMLVN